MSARAEEFKEVPRRRRIRKAQASDARAIAALVDSAESLRQISPLETFPLDASTVLHWLLQRDAGHVLEDRGEIVAYGELVPDERRPHRFWIGHMIVHPRRRGLGVGQRLVQELLRIAERERGAREVAISAFADNPRALRCYEACGFERVDEERVGGRPLVGMRHRIASRMRSPRTPYLLLTGLASLGLAATIFLPSVRTLATEAPFAVLAAVVQPVVVLLAFPLRRERRIEPLHRLRAAALRVGIANLCAFAFATIVVAGSGAPALVLPLAGTFASATLVWIALVVLALLRERRG